MAQQPSAYPTPGSNNNASAQGYQGGSSTNSNTTSTTTGSSSQNTNSSKNTTTKNQNMSDSALAGLEALIAQLLGGGTNQQAQETAKRQQEINAVQGLRAGYGKSDAFADATGAMSQQLRKAMEQILPSLVRSTEGAGTSQNSLRGLLLQDAMNKASESSSALGLKAAVDYGNISTGLSNTLEALTRPQNKVVDSLLTALGIAKGAVTSGTVSEIGNTNSTSNSSQITNSETNSVVTDYKTPTNSFSGSNSFGGNDQITMVGNGNKITDAQIAKSLENQGYTLGQYGAWNGFQF